MQRRLLVRVTQIHVQVNSKKVPSILCQAAESRNVKSMCSLLTWALAFPTPPL